VAELVAEAEWILADMRGEGGRCRPAEARDPEVPA
jgi:hypothetical protein